MRRREFLTLFGGAAAARPFAVRAQQATLPAVGALRTVTGDTPGWLTFRQALQELGYVDGRNVWLESPAVQSDYVKELPALASRLASLPADVIVTFGGVATRAAAAASKTIPIVQAAGGDLVREGLAASMARPGGNVTGFINTTVETGKRLELLRDALPNVRRVAFLVRPGIDLRPTFDAARALGLELIVIEAGTVADLQALRLAGAKGADAIHVVSDSFFAGQSDEIVVAVAASRLPAFFSDYHFVKSGGLMSYHEDVIENIRRAAGYVARILRGEKPGDLPVQQPEKFFLSVNLKTAKALGIAIPDSFLARADEVIE